MDAASHYDVIPISVNCRRVTCSEKGKNVLQNFVDSEPHRQGGFGWPFFDIFFMSDK